MVYSLKYLGRVITAADDDWASFISNLRNFQKQWVQMSRILGREGSNARVSGLFYKAVVQSVLIYGLEKWFLTPRVVRTLRVFH